MASDSDGDSTPTLQPEEFGERSVTLRMDHEEALAHVRDVFGEVGFSFPTEFSPAERINAKRNVDLEPYTVIGLGVPAAGEHALEAGGKRVGALVAQVENMVDDAFADLGRGTAGRHRGIDG